MEDCKGVKYQASKAKVLSAWKGYIHWLKDGEAQALLSPEDSLDFRMVGGCCRIAGCSSDRKPKQGPELWQRLLPDVGGVKCGQEMNQISLSFS